MSSLLTSPDLKRLRDEGYEVEVRSAHLLVHSVPYLNSKKEVCLGTLISTLTLAGNVTATPDTHVAFFDGEFPCRLDGVEIPQIKHGGGEVHAAGVKSRWSFSNKPPNGYSNYYDKMTRYIEIISGPARQIDPDATAQTFKVIPPSDGDSVFLYDDTASSRAGIAVIAEKVKKQRIAIVGLGGTGSFVLDLIAKSPVKEIHLFDGDVMLQHNAFRTPGALSLEELEARPPKVIYYERIYGRMRRGIVANHVYITSHNVHLLREFDTVFICVDKGSARQLIVEALIGTKVIFIDTGMGITLLEPEMELLGVCRVTTSTAAKRDHLARRLPLADRDDDDLYKQNIQIVDLNCLNATLAVIKWKKLLKVYQDLENEHDSTYSTNSNLLTGDEIP